MARGRGWSSKIEECRSQPKSWGRCTDMAKILCSNGCRGEIVKTIQSQLQVEGFLQGAADGVYANQTTAAVRSFQEARHLAISGTVDQPTWAALLPVPPPDLQQRSLQVTAAFEGHGFGLAQGNFDGAGITWGIIGFTLKSGKIAKLIKGIDDAHPELVRGAFGDQSNELLEVLTKMSWADQLAWASSRSSGLNNTTLSEPWRSGFARLGTVPAVQEAQLALVREDYFVPARDTAEGYDLKSELGRALVFDIHVQNGGIKPKTAARIAQARAQAEPATERDLRVLIAKAVAATARPAYRDDVGSRKLTLATGEGTVHGFHYELANWGLDESQAQN